MVGSTFLACTIALLTSLSSVPVTYDSPASIETSNVANDLRILYGGDKADSFNLASLYPSENDIYSDFAFYRMYPYNSSLYLYCYEKVSNSSLAPANCTVVLSNSTVQDENLDFVENYTTWDASLVNMYGENNVHRFYKFRIDNVLDVSVDQRIYIDSMRIDYVDTNGSYHYGTSHSVGDELWVNLEQGQEDFVYEYYDDEYIYIEDSEQGRVLTPYEYTDHITKNSFLSGNGVKYYDYRSFYQDTYYMFNPVYISSSGQNVTVDDLISVRYTYNKVDFEAETSFTGVSRYKTVGKAPAYTGTLNGDLTGSYYHDSWADNYNMVLEGINIVNTEQVNTTVESEVVDHTAGNSHFLWGTSKKKRNFEFYFDTIFNMEDVESIALGTDSQRWKKQYQDDNFCYRGLYDFVHSVNDPRAEEGLEPYQWMFLVDSSIVSVDQEASSYNAKTKTLDVITDCVDCQDTLVTWMEFKYKDDTYDLHVLSNPTSTSFTFTVDNGVPTIWNQVKTYFNETSSTFLNILMWIGIGLGIILLIVVIILIVRGCRMHSKNKNSNNKGSGGGTLNVTGDNVKVYTNDYYQNNKKQNK